MLGKPNTGLDTIVNVSVTGNQNDGGKESSVFTHSFRLFSAYSQFLPVFRCHHVIVLLVTSTHIIQITQNVISIANFNLILDIEIESTEHRAHV